jgi:hypothetical protein
MAVPSETGNPWTVFINSIKMKVAYIVYDANGTQLAYVDGSTFLEDTLPFKDVVTNATIATLQRNRVSLDWTWDFSIANLTHPVG